MTGRPRRCGWFDAAALRRAVQLNGVTGLCITKLDVLDGSPTVQLCTGYRYRDQTVDILPFGADQVAQCEPVYQEFAGWAGSTFGVQQWSDLPQAAQNYLSNLSELAGVPIDLISTGPERDQTIVLRHPFTETS